MLTLKMESRPENIELALGYRKESQNRGTNLKNEGVNLENEIKQNKSFIRRKSILCLVKEADNITTSTLSTALSCSEAIIERDISWLRKNGYIIRNGSDKSGRWLILKGLGEDE